MGFGVGDTGDPGVDGAPLGCPDSDGTPGDPEGPGSAGDVTPSDGETETPGDTEPTSLGAPLPAEPAGRPVLEACASVAGTTEGLSTGPGLSMSWLDEGSGAGGVVTPVASRT